jgi:signal transduction histidine kinase
VLQGIAQLAVGPLLSAEAFAAQRASVERLRDLDRMKSDLIASVSHELRTPLTAIQGFAQTLHSRGDDLPLETRSDFLVRIVKHCGRLTHLVEGILAASRWEEARQEDEGAVDIEQAIGEVLTELAGSYDVSRVRVVVPASLPPARAAVERVEHIVRNLVENALKFSPETASVRLSVHHDAQSLIIEVADEGPGIPESDLPHIFERFHQVGGSLRRRGDGFGLGLYIAKRAVEALQGTIDVESVVGCGTTFRVRLPVEQSNDQSEIA